MSTASQMHEFENVADKVSAMKNSGLPLSNSTMRNVRVSLGIDEDLRMILEMDPSIIDLGNTNVEDYSPQNYRHVLPGLPPKSGGYVDLKHKSHDLLNNMLMNSVELCK